MEQEGLVSCKVVRGRRWNWHIINVKLTSLDSWDILETGTTFDLPGMFQSPSSQLKLQPFPVLAAGFIACSFSKEELFASCTFILFSGWHTKLFLARIKGERVRTSKSSCDIGGQIPFITKRSLAIRMALVHHIIRPSDHRFLQGSAELGVYGCISILTQNRANISLTGMGS